MLSDDISSNLRLGFIKRGVLLGKEQRYFTRQRKQRAKRIGHICPHWSHRSHVTQETNGTNETYFEAEITARRYSWWGRSVLESYRLRVRELRRPCRHTDHRRQHPL